VSIHLDQIKRGMEAKLTQPTIIVNQIAGCARCGETHADLSFALLQRPIEEHFVGNRVQYTHWAPCPKTGEPVLLLIAGEGN
jgi:hypothetical protein